MADDKLLTLPWAFLPSTEVLGACSPLFLSLQVA